MDGLGLYIAVPFCRSKCSYCNFASQVYPPAVYEGYAQLLAREIGLAAAADGLRGATLESIYWGGGTPTLLPPTALATIMAAVRSAFHVPRAALVHEHTMEAAPGTLTADAIATMLAAGVNRVSLGVQSFVDAEARAVGRLHTRAVVLNDLERLRAAGITNLNLDLIAGLPHQTASSWADSLQVAMDTGVPHLSIYMLEVDEDSRLGGELLAGGVRYHAHSVPDEDWIATAYETACCRLEAGGWRQYEISNFARPHAEVRCEARHNERYWLRQPYLGVGVAAHSMLIAPARRFCNPEELEAWIAPLRRGELPRGEVHPLSPAAEREEQFFLGLRRTRGVQLAPGHGLDARLSPLTAGGLIERDGDRIALTARGRLLSNRVFAEFLDLPLTAAARPLA